jgi:hypothetical protein
MCQHMILIEHWSTSVEATGWHEMWSSECALTHALSCLDFQVFMADVDQMMCSGFWHSAGLWVVSVVSEERASIFSGHWVLPRYMQKERQNNCSPRNVQFNPSEATLPYLCYRKWGLLFFTLHCHLLDSGKGSYVCNDTVYIFTFVTVGPWQGPLSILVFFMFALLHSFWPRQRSVHSLFPCFWVARLRATCI